MSNIQVTSSGPENTHSALNLCKATRKLILIFATVLSIAIVAVALGVGLGVGLNK
ncbi:hypothetical protein V1520DRAFT_358846 [Lipomyces starkeyi]